MTYRLPASLITAALLVSSLSGCGSKSNAAASANGKEVSELRYQGAANTVTLAELAQDLGYFGTIKLKWVGNTISGPQDIQSAATDQTDFGGAFTGAVVKLVEAGAPVKAVIDYYGEDAKTFNGVYVKADSSIHSPRDLLGKKIAVNTLGAHYEALIDTYLARNGLSAEEIKQVQLVVLPPNSTEEAIRKGQVDAGILGGVLQDNAIAVGGLRSLFNDFQLFGAFNGGQYVLRTAFIKQNPTVSKTFVNAIAKAIEWERTTPRDQVIDEFTKIITARGRNESTATLKYWKSVGVATKGGQIRDSDFTQWSEWLNKSGIVHGTLTPSKYYTNELNTFAAGNGNE